MRDRKNYPLEILNQSMVEGTNEIVKGRTCGLVSSLSFGRFVSSSRLARRNSD